jgi:hypothetical protein
VFLGDAGTPVMVVDRLAHDPAPGFIGFGSFDDGDVKPGERTTAIANIVVRPDEFEHDFAAARAATVSPGLIREWEVSAPFVAPGGAVQTLPPDVLAGPWRPAATEPDGLLLFDRVIAPPEGARRATALARVTIPTTQARTLRLRLGFSDDVSVFLNGTLLYSGVNGYSYNFPRRDGLITIDQASLYLPLRQGLNSLVFAVSDTFGGWGLIAQTMDDGGNHADAR